MKSETLYFGTFAAIVAAVVGLSARSLSTDPVGNIDETQVLTSPPAYNRDAFGGWVDADSDCQTTRNEVLLRDLTEVMLDVQGCRVLSGFMSDPYTGERVAFTYGRTTSNDVQIDHVVPLKAAWDAGAWAWTDERRRAFANDLDNLVATKASVNSSKGALLPSSWAPRTLEPCDYLVTVLQVATSWELDLPAGEDRFLAEQVGACPTPMNE